MDIGEFLGSCSIKKNDGNTLRYLEVDIMDLYIKDLDSKTENNFVSKNKLCKLDDLTYA